MYTYVIYLLYIHIYACILYIYKPLFFTHTHIYIYYCHSGANSIKNLANVWHSLRGVSPYGLFCSHFNIIPPIFRRAVYYTFH